MTTAALSLDDHLAGVLNHASYLASGRYRPAPRKAPLPTWPALPSAEPHPAARLAKSAGVALAGLVIATHLMNIAWFIGGKPARPTLVPVATQTAFGPRSAHG